jgi:flagellar biosynthesis regulator FlaF
VQLLAAKKKYLEFGLNALYYTRMMWTKIAALTKKTKSPENK